MDILTVIDHDRSCLSLNRFLSKTMTKC